MKKREKKLMHRLKRILAICLMIGIIGETGYLDVYAASNKDVTSRYKNSVTKMLRHFDSYFGIGCKKSTKVKFDIYAKSTMAYFAYPQSYPESLYGKSVSYVQKKLKNNMKLYFGSSTPVKFKKNKAQKAYSIATDNPSNLIQNVDGRIMYVGGNWDVCASPRGYVEKILRTSSGKYQVTYRIMCYYLQKS